MRVLLWRQRHALKIMLFVILCLDQTLGFAFLILLSATLLHFHSVSGSWKPLMNSEILFFIFLLVTAFYLIWEIYFSSQLFWLKLQRCSALWVGWGKVGMRLFQDRGCINLNRKTWNCLRYLSVCSCEGGSNYWCQLVSKTVCMWSMKQGGGSWI